MKTTIIALGLLVSSMATAQTITCKITPFLADKAGYLMPADLITITTPEKPEAAGMKKCAQVETAAWDLSLCANENDLVGGTSVDLTTRLKNPTALVENTYSWYSFGTSRTSNMLILLDQETEVNGDIRQKMHNAGLEMPYTLNPQDSSSVDEAVKEGLKANIIAPNDVIAVQVDSCKTN